MSEREIRALGGVGILEERDLEDFHVSEKRVAMLMSDGKWHSGRIIRLAAGGWDHEASEGLRRFRAVRARLEPKGYRFERIRSGDGRSFLYRMLPPTDEGRLF